MCVEVPGKFGVGAVDEGRLAGGGFMSEDEDKET